MQIFPECYVCQVRLAVSAMNSAGIDQQTQLKIIKVVLGYLEGADPKLIPSILASQTIQIISEETKIDDLYQEEKKKSHLLAEAYIGDLRALLGQGKDILEQGLKISAAGNIIDVVHASDYDLWEEVIKTVGQELKGGGVESFRKALKEAPYLLYMADNVGETIFDRVFIETLDIPVLYAVKGGAILNDATLEDALAAGIDLVAEILETGSRAPGTVLSQCSPDFQKLFKESNLVLAKGQANYETLDDQGDKVFFLLRTKCPLVSREIGIPVGNLVMKQGKPLE